MLLAADRRRDCGEARFRIIGEIDGSILVCVYTVRACATYRIISLRHANRRERDAYRASFPR